MAEDKLPALLKNLAQKIPYTRLIVLATGDAMYRAHWGGDRDAAEQLAALIASKFAISRTIAKRFTGDDTVLQSMDEFRELRLMTVRAAHGANIAMLLGDGADLSSAAYELEKLVMAVGPHLVTPDRVQHTVPPERRA